MNSTAKKLYDYENPKAPKKTHKVKKQPKMKKRKPSPFPKGLFILSIIGIFVVGLFILRGYANITTVRAEISRQEAVIDDLEKRMTDLSVQIETIKSSSQIEEDALFKLGLVYPEDEQKVYVNVPEPEQVKPITKTTEIAARFKTVLQFFSGAF